MDRTDSNKKKVLEALIKCNGVVTAAVESAGLSRSNFYKWKEDDEEFRAQVEDVQEIALDFVESKLFNTIKDENVTSIIFYLKTRGKKRGYIEQQDHRHSGELKHSVFNVNFKGSGVEPINNEEDVSLD